MLLPSNDRNRTVEQWGGRKEVVSRGLVNGRLSCVVSTSAGFYGVNNKCDVRLAPLYLTLLVSYGPGVSSSSLSRSRLSFFSQAFIYARQRVYIWQRSLSTRLLKNFRFPLDSILFSRKYLPSGFSHLRQQLFTQRSCKFHASRSFLLFFSLFFFFFTRYRFGDKCLQLVIPFSSLLSSFFHNYQRFHNNTDFSRV